MQRDALATMLTREANRERQRAIADRGKLRLHVKTTGSWIGWISEEPTELSIWLLATDLIDAFEPLNEQARLLQDLVVDMEVAPRLRLTTDVVLAAPDAIADLINRLALHQDVCRAIT